MNRKLDLYQWKKAFTQESSGLDATARLVLHVLSTFISRQTNSAWPSQKTLARDAALSERTVGKKLELAVKLGWLTRERRGTTGSTGWVYEYSIALRSEAVSELRGTTTEPRSAVESTEGAKIGNQRQQDPNVTTPRTETESANGRSGFGQTNQNNPITNQREVPLPDDFELTDEMRKWAMETRPVIDVDHATDKFILHRKAQGTRAADWEALWKLWMLREEKDSLQRGSTNGKLTTRPQNKIPTIEQAEMIGKREAKNRMVHESDQDWCERMAQYWR